MKIAVFDYQVTRTNPIGSCHRAMLSALCNEHEFTVFSKQFDNPDPARITWVQVPSILRPLAALFVSFHIVSRVRYWRKRGTFSLIQSVESNLSFGDVVYSQFCHRWFLKHRWSACRMKGVRGWFRWIDHALHAALEPITFRRARWIVVPSRGLAKELRGEYPACASKIRVIANPVDLRSYSRPAEFEREAFRQGLGIEPDDTAIVFVALGQYERKGLPLLLEALAQERPHARKLVVVGGPPDLVETYSRRAEFMGLQDSVRFVGHQTDIRPFLWSADLFALPSLYEAFPLVALQAAASGCPVLITQLNGAEEYLKDRQSCLLVEPTAQSVASGLSVFERLSKEDRRKLGGAAQDAVAGFGEEVFAEAWRELYREIEPSRSEMLDDLSLRSVRADS